MATTIGSKIAGIERDCLALVSVLNAHALYREGSHVQGLLTQVANVRTSLEQGEPPPAELEFQVKT